MARCPAWSRRAKQDLRDIAEFNRRAGKPVHKVEAIIADIRNAARAACTFAARRQTPETDDPNVREVFTETHRIIYLMREPGIVVIRVVHMSQDVTAKDLEL